MNEVRTLDLTGYSQLYKELICFGLKNKYNKGEYSFIFSTKLLELVIYFEDDGLRFQLPVLYNQNGKFNTITLRMDSRQEFLDIMAALV
jgi:hypothetical protein